MTPDEARLHVMELALLVKEYQMSGGAERQSMRGVLARETDLIRKKHGESEFADIIRRVEATMSGARFPDLTLP